MPSKEHSALTTRTTASQAITERSTVLILAIACGLAVANLYYNQPLLADIGRSFHICVQQVGFIPTLTQIGYAIGLLPYWPLRAAKQLGHDTLSPVQYERAWV